MAAAESSPPLSDGDTEAAAESSQPPPSDVDNEAVAESSATQPPPYDGDTEAAAESSPPPPPPSDVDIEAVAESSAPRPPPSDGDTEAAAESSPPQTSPSDFSLLIPIPKINTRETRGKRKVAHAVIVTSSPFKQQLKKTKDEKETKVVAAQQRNRIREAKREMSQSTQKRRKVTGKATRLNV